MGMKLGSGLTLEHSLPIGWELARVGAIASFTSGTGIRVSVLAPESSAAPVPVYGGNGIAGYTNRALVTTPTVVVGRVGQKCGEVYLTDGPAWITDNALYPRTRHRSFDLRFLGLALSNAGLNDVKNKNDLPLVTQSILHSVKIAWPKRIEEQSAIADTVHEFDALLGGLDRLIAKKCDLKQAATQQLLTGNTRLPGFKGAWTEVSLKLICSLKSGEGITSRSIDESSKYPCYGGNGLRGFTSRWTHDGRHALIGRVGALCGNVLGVEGKFFASEHAIVVSPLPQTDIGWLTYVLRRMNLNQYSESSAQPVLTVSKLFKLSCSVPPTKSEQFAISQVLSDMDFELAALERRREKTRCIRQGVIQELLTGRTRLV